MAWFGDRLLKWRPFRGNACMPLDTTGDASGEAPDSIPSLVVLVPDAYGCASYHIHHFAGLEPASDFVQYWFRSNPPQGLIIFWALTWEPAPCDGEEPPYPAEPVVLIRDEERPGTVYPFSFVDIATAHSFVRQEARWALDLARVSIYWATPLAIEADFEGIYRLRPEPPPQRPEAGQAPSPQVLDTVAVQSAPAPIMQDRPPAFFAPEEPLSLEPAWPDPPADDSLEPWWREAEAGEPPSFGATAGPAASLVPAMPPLARSPDPVAPAAGTVEDGSPGGDDISAPTEEYGAGGAPHIIKPECVNCLLAEIENAVVGSGDHPAPVPSYDIYDEVRRVLQTKRWDEQDEPFHGFDSPPGRF